MSWPYTYSQNKKPIIRNEIEKFRLMYKFRIYDLHEFESFDEIIDVVAEWLQWRIGQLVPHLGQLADQQAIRQGFKVRRHHKQTFERFLQTRQARSDNVCQAAISTTISFYCLSNSMHLSWSTVTYTWQSNGETIIAAVCYISPPLQPQQLQ